MNRALDALPVLQPDEDAAALLAARGLHHDGAMLVEKRLDAVVVGRLDLLGDMHPGTFDDAARDRLVVADLHRNAGGQFAQGLAAAQRAPAIGQTEEAALAIGHLDVDEARCRRRAAPPRLVDEETGIGVQALFRRGADEELLVDRVLALHCKERHPVEAELLIERDRHVVVVQNREIHVGGAARKEMLGQRAHQRLAYARLGRLGIDREAP